jgi:hypothetical protein
MKVIMLNEISQTQKDKYHNAFSYMQGIDYKKKHKVDYLERERRR